MATFVLLGAVLAGLALLAFMAISRRRVLAAPAPVLSEDCPGVSILKPLKGADPALAANLASFLRQDHPRFEILCGAADPADPALAVARAVAAAHPGAPLRILPGAPPRGRNPKVANLEALARHARFPVLLVSDGNTEAPPGLVRDLAARLAPGVGVVSAPIAARPGRGLGAELESLQLHAFVMGGAAALASLPRGVCVVGKAMMVRRADLEALGGFPFLGGYLAEDQVCGEEMRRLGLRSVLGSVPVRNPLGDLGVRSFAERHVRWARLRARICPAGYAGEILLHPVALAAAGAAALGSPEALGILALAVAGRVLHDVAADRAAGLRRSVARLALLAPVRDVVTAALWPLGFLGSSVGWRGGAYRIGARTRILPARGPEEDLVPALR